jgi:hypothetical protein
MCGKNIYFYYFYLFPFQVRRKHNKENKGIQADLRNISGDKVF